MKLVMTLLARDEEDIIRHNIDFHRAVGVDYFLATDNLSQDGTREVLKEYEAQGILKYFYSDDDTHSQHAHVTKMSRLASSEFGADWVINNDADEFWFPKGSRSLKDVFASVPKDAGVVEFKRTNFVPLKFFTPPFYEHMVYAQRKSTNWLGEPLPGKTAHRGSESVVVSQGNHSASMDGAGATLQRSDIDILHFTAREFDRWEASIVHGGQAYARNRTLKKRTGIVRRTVYAEYEELGSLQNFYERNFYGRRDLVWALMKREVVRDVRLRRFFATLKSVDRPSG